MEVSEKDIETLREAIDGCGGSSYTQALAILDRLSPAPEVDEATVWTRRLFLLEYPGEEKAINNGDRDGNPYFKRVADYLRQAIAELIASKDGEIAMLTGERDRQYDENVNRIAAEGAAIVRVEKAESELAALRAENEPPAGYKHIKLACKNTIFDFNRLNRPDGTWILLDGVNVNVTPKAAERNTAEPANEGIPNRDYSDAKATDALKEAVALSRSRSGGMPPGTNAGAVEVTEADIEFANELISGFRKTTKCYYADAKDAQHWIVKGVFKYRTEAEARGRREALKWILDRSAELHRQGYSAAYTLDAIEAELKRLMGV